MLKRFLRGRGDDGGADPGNAQLDARLLAALERLAQTPREGPTNDPLVDIGRAVIGVETEAGYPELPGEQPEPFLRTYATLLLDNDRQPRSLQISAADMKLPRALLVAFFSNAPAMHGEAQKVLRFIEERFSQGRFGQARLLLQLFDTDPSTRRNNERNIFYEEMTLRLLSQRATSVPSSAADEVRTALQACASDRSAIAGAFATIDAKYGVRFNLRFRDSDLGDAWREALGGGGPESAAVDRLVPGLRWRHLPEGAELSDLLHDHASELDVSYYTLALIRAAYFVTLAPGKTGYENLVMSLMPWLAETFDTVATRVLPRLHRATIMEEMSLTDALDAIWIELLSQAEIATTPLNSAQLVDTLDVVVADLAKLDFSRIPEGEYDVGGVIIERVLGFDSGDLATSLRLHRLT